MSVFDNILKQAVFTEKIVKPAVSQYESAGFPGLKIAPKFNLNSQYVAMTTQAEYATGIGQFSSPEATPPLVDMPGRERSEQIFEMVRLDEMLRISPTVYEALQSNDETVAGRALKSIAEYTQDLVVRNSRLSEKMRWDAFLTNQLSVTVNVNGQATGATTLVVPDYGIPSTNRVTAGTLWTDTANADVVAQLIAWRKKVADETGYLASICHITSEDTELLIANEKVKTYFNIVPGQPFRPTLEQIASLVAAGAGSFRFEVVDAGYRLQSAGSSLLAADHTRYLPVGKVLLTTEYTIGGQKIADTPNGLVEVTTGYNSTALKTGPVGEVLLNDMSKQRFLRYASREIPRINVPGAFFTATVR